MYIKKYQNLIKKYIDNYLLNIKNENLRTILNYSLSDGKYLRSIMCLEISYLLSGEYDYELALSIELLHNASLIIDDLPCMDNDKYRRNKLTVHAKYGENVAKIVAYFMIFEALKLIKDLNFELIIEYINNIKKAAIGQYYDLKNLNDKNINNHKLNLKTSPFFYLVFVCTYKKYKKCDKNILEKLDIIYSSFSNFFQIYDDFEDIEKDKKNNVLNKINMFGKQKCLDEFKNHISLFKNNLIELNLHSNLFDEIIKYFNNKINNRL